MSYKQRVTLFLVVDTCIVLISIFISYFLVEAKLNMMTNSLIVLLLAVLTNHHSFAFKFHLYKKAWEYAGIGELLVIIKVVSASIVGGAIIQQVLIQEVPFRLLAVAWLLTIMLIGGSRFCFRLYRTSYINNGQNSKRAIIVGAGSAGIMVARQLLKNNKVPLVPVGFIDDDPKKQGLDILGIPVLGGVPDILEMVNLLDIDNIVIAIPSLSKKGLHKIFQECAKTTAKTKILPMLEDLVTGKVSVNQFRDVNVEDLLGREPIQLDIESISQYITGKTILITGAGGSIGSEICRQVASFQPTRMILLGHGENSIYTIESELIDLFEHTGIEFIPEITDIQDAAKVNLVMKMYQPDVVYHAAAHKHVPLMERNPEEAIKNNVIGTLNVAKAASCNEIKNFVMVSTDKAVNPTSVMGATKRLAEIIVQEMNKQSNTKFVAVRFGNVLGSRGSVIPLFKKQIAKGGPITVTHPDMVRYFMTIPEASRLVIQAGALAKGGEIFVLDMGDPVKIEDLAKNLIKLSGHSIEDIGIKYTGIRTGEKLFEELLKDEEVYDKQIYPNIYIGKRTQMNTSEIEEFLNNFSNMERPELRKNLLILANKKLEFKTAMAVSV